MTETQYFHHAVSPGAPGDPGTPSWESENKQGPSTLLTRVISIISHSSQSKILSAQNWPKTHPLSKRVSSTRGALHSVAGADLGILARRDE